MTPPHQLLWWRRPCPSLPHLIKTTNYTIIRTYNSKGPYSIYGASTIFAKRTRANDAEMRFSRRCKNDSVFGRKMDAYVGKGG